MEIYSIDIREFKSTFYTSMSIMLLFIVGAWIWVNNDIGTFSIFSSLKGFSSPILIMMMVIAIVYGSYRRKRLNAINAGEDFSVKVKEYLKIYKLHSGWFILSCFVSCFLYVVTLRTFFLYFALFEVLLSLPGYPTRSLFQKELKNEEVVVY